MKVLFIARPNLFVEKGGDTTQLLSTAKYLKRLGVDVEFGVNNESITYDNYDLIHFFNIIDPEDILGHMLRSSKPSVLSTIYVNYREFDRYHRKGWIGIISRLLPYHAVEYLKTLAKFILRGERVSSYRYFLWGNKRSIKYILRHVTHLLPNSYNELKRLEASFGALPPSTIIPNAVDREIFLTDGEQEVERTIVLCVARIEGNKNQLNLIKAFKTLPYKLILVGKVSPNQQSYYEDCLKEAGDNVIFINQLKQEELSTYYRQAKVHVLPSWFETTGLSSLEAAALGCNIVVGDKGDVRDYFGEFAYYCNPGDPVSIATAIRNAFESPCSKGLKEMIMEKYTWEKAASETLRAYKKALNHD